MSSVPSNAAEVVKVDLSAGSVHTVLVDGEPHVLLRPAVETLGLDWKNQHEKLRRRSWACVVQQTMQVPGDRQARNHSLGTVETFLMLLATVNEHRVAEDVRPILVAFQRETAKAIADYWTTGIAARPAVEQQPEHPTTVTWDHAAAIARIRYGLDVDVSDFRELLNKGGILTNTGKPHRKWEHLFWPLPTRWEIHASVLPQLIQFALKVRRELAAAEEDLQMSLPLPMSILVGDATTGPRQIQGGGPR